VPFELPDNWVWARISDVCEPQETKHPVGDTFRYIDIDAIDNKRHSVSEPKTTLTSQAPSRAAKGVRSGDTLFSMVRPYLENIAYITEELSDCIASTGFYVCKPCKEILFPKYLYYFLISNQAISGINAYMRGDNSPSIRKDEMDSFLVPIPPISEQERITELLDRTLMLIDDVDVEKNTLTEAVAATKSKVLSLAIQGKLVPQDPNDEPASVLLERIRAERENLIKAGKIKRNKNESTITRSDDNSYYVNNEDITDFLPFNIPLSWMWVTLDQISDNISAGGDRPTVFSESKTVECPVPIYSNGLSNTGLYGYTDKATIIEPSVTVSARGTIGYSCIRYEPFCPIVRLISVTPNLKIISLEYLYRTLCHLIPQGEGSSIPQLTVPTLKPKFMPIPPLAEQQRIVTAIAVAFEQLDTISTMLT